MESVNFNRRLLPPMPVPVGGAAASVRDGLEAIRQDALRLSGASSQSAPAIGGAPPPGNVPAVLARVQQDALQAQQAGDTVLAQRLENFAGILQGVAGDAEAASLVAQAYVNPSASEGARRLHQTLLGSDPNPSSNLLGLLAFDGPGSANWRATHPNNAMSGHVTGADIASDLIKEIVDPSKVFQGNRQTCGAASTQILLAREAPGELIRLVSSLAANGTATLQSGGTVTRPADWDFHGDGNRSEASRLLQPAFMAYASGGASYDNVNDKSVDASGARSGLLTTEMQRLLTDVTARQTQMVQVRSWDASNTRWLDVPRVPDPLIQIQESTGKGWAVPVLLTLQPNQSYGHFVMVKDVTSAGVRIINPWGYEETLSLDTFRQRLVGAYFQ
jgi:hypothetical protein